jgi:hypothetical protein
LKEFPANAIPDYVILSHTWLTEEVTFQDIETPEVSQKKGVCEDCGLL